MRIGPREIKEMLELYAAENRGDAVYVMRIAYSCQVNRNCSMFPMAVRRNLLRLSAKLSDSELISKVILEASSIGPNCVYPNSLQRNNYQIFICNCGCRSLPFVPLYERMLEKRKESQWIAAGI